MEFVTKLQEAFQANANIDNQKQMEVYMRYLFRFHGIKAPIRKQLIKELLPDYKSFLQENIRAVVTELYNLPQREYHYTAMELYQKFSNKKYELKDGRFFTRMITTHSWWDSVDFLAKHVFGKYLLQFPEQKRKMLDFYSKSDNMWLNRAAILHQLSYKNETDQAELFKQCIVHKESEEFFIQKAIGWALREYGKVQPEAVLNFVKTTKLKELSEREAIRRLI
ncbi:DNA alkylation repair protein [Kordia sp. YSTF-M3]|uniref:DNA alkylation repair protein n=1 Tax=Kordia aestuariivivens TaxID=2759037 RepID=A0ABR7Q8J5_9FLAO|nr:DNA alkylation repair protein [Kordia aestuariivivens]MBC8754884.1 DNA alkylation repair protein [Kordia aestuariivivens]